jgi:hypothetical protein
LRRPSFARLLRHVRVGLADLVQVFFFQFLEIEHLVLGVANRADDLVELDLHRFRVAVLRGLNQEHHQERDDGRAGVDDQLPGVTEPE